MNTKEQKFYADNCGSIMKFLDCNEIEIRMTNNGLVYMTTKDNTSDFNSIVNESFLKALRNMQEQIITETKSIVSEKMRRIKESAIHEAIENIKS